MFYCEKFIGKNVMTVLETLLKRFRACRKKAAAYSFLPVSFSVSITLPRSFKDNRVSIVFTQEKFLNCLVCLFFLRVDWSQVSFLRNTDPVVYVSLEIYEWSPRKSKTCDFTRLCRRVYFFIRVN